MTVPREGYVSNEETGKTVELIFAAELLVEASTGIHLSIYDETPSEEGLKMSLR